MNRPLSVLAIVIQFGFYLLLVSGTCYGAFFLATRYHDWSTPQALLVSGRIMSSDKTEFLNDRMVVFFLT